MLGTNDSKPQNWQYRLEFMSDLKALINKFKYLPSLDLTDLTEGAYSLTVQFAVTIDIEEDLTSELKVIANCNNFGYEVGEVTVLDIQDLYICHPNEMMQLQVQPGTGPYPTFGNNVNDFGAAYTAKESINTCKELAWLDSEDGIGYQYPKKDLYLNKLNNDLTSNNYQTNDKAGTPIDDEEYRFVTFKYSLDKIHDLCGFSIALHWVYNKPTVSDLDGTLKDVISLRHWVAGDEATFLSARHSPTTWRQARHTHDAHQCCTDMRTTGESDQ